MTVLPNGRFAVSFTTLHQPGGSFFDVAVRSFDNAGGTPSAEVIVNAPLDVNGYQWDSTVAAVGTSGDYVVAYHGFTDYSSSQGSHAYRGDVFLQRFDANGAQNGSPFIAHAPHAEHPVVTALANGTIVVAWQSHDADADATDILVEMFPLPPVFSSGPFVANTYSATYQQAPAMAALSGGGFVVVWQSFQQDGDNNGIYAQRYDGAGAPQGTEVMVHVTTAAHQMNPSVTATANGGFAVSWDSGVYDLLNPNGMGVIRARMFDANGDPIPVSGAGNDRLYGGGGNDKAYGGWGDDFLDGGAGADSLYGGADDDNAIGMGGTDRLFGGAGDDTLEGGAQNDTLQGGDGADELWGETENDRLAGGAGDDSLNGEAGLDSLSGGTGADSLTGGGGNDSLSGGADDDRLAGGSGADTLKGDAGDDTLWGNGGNDSVLGGTGDDSLLGGAGADTMNGNAGNDTMNGGTWADLLLGGGGDDSLLGGAGADRLEGQTGADHLHGGTGADRITGGAGVDMMTGGGGADTFVFTAASHSGNGTSADRITDFVSGVDRIDLDAIDAMTGGGVYAGVQDFQFIGAAAFGAVRGELRHDAATGMIQADRNGDGVADMEILLVNLTASLAPGDFIL